MTQDPHASNTSSPCDSVRATIASATANDAAQATAVLAMAQAFDVSLRQSGDRWRPSADQRFESAVVLYRTHRWADAYNALAALADENDASAAVLALLMLRYGARLYGNAFRSEPPQIARWAKLGLQAQRVADQRRTETHTPSIGTRPPAPPTGHDVMAY